MISELSALEKDLLAKQGPYFGIDEVGRGALAGPVALGVALVSGTPAQLAGVPKGLNDSKALTEKRREALFDPLREWVSDYAVGFATAAEVDRLGIVLAMRVAGARAIREIVSRQGPVKLAILDGPHAYLQLKPGELFPERLPELAYLDGIEFLTEVKADGHIAACAAAAVLAKVTRDRYMRELPDPGYGWAKHKGYGTAAHRAAIKELGASSEHRQSWHL